MPRNFNRRVEVMFPIEAPELKQRICKEIVPIYLNDNTRARSLQSDGTYGRLEPWNGEAEHRAQFDLLQTAKATEPVRALPQVDSANGKAANKRSRSKPTRSAG